MNRRPIALIILDGYGLAEPSPTNAVHMAKTPVFDKLWQANPHTELCASGKEVGLPPGQMGNSEVGHLNLGAGRVVMQSLSFINDQIENGEFFENRALNAVMSQVGPEGSLHVLGLVSRGRVHSDLDHLLALLKLTESQEVKRVYLHLFTDGRDCAPDSGLEYVREVSEKVQGTRASIASICGRYFAMDRDRRWSRIERAYRAIVEGESELRATDPVAAIQASYDNEKTDEFVEPVVIVDSSGEPIGPMADGDGVIFFNFRADRAREMTYALLGDEEWSEFERGRRVKDLHYCSFMNYDEAWGMNYAFELPELTNPLAQVLADAGKRQYHTGETEKYPHVTYFFNAKIEAPFDGETREMVNSPKVATYDMKPEMSAPELAEKTASRIREGVDDFVLINFANPDMVGHTGDLRAAIEACEASDVGLGKVVEALDEMGGCYLVVADHGNAEYMQNPDGSSHTAHTTNLVPCILGGKHEVKSLLANMALGSVAPTILELMGLEAPAEMTAKSLVAECLS